MARTISDRLSAAARTAFVGREEELALVHSAIVADELPFNVGYIHGPGGIGKSTFLEGVLRDVARDTRTVLVDCRDIEPTAKGFLSAVARAAGATDGSSEVQDVARQLGKGTRRTVFAVDTYERLRLLDSWLRREFIPSLPETVLTLLASREPPSPAWLTSPGWHGLFREVKLGGLADKDAIRMLALRGLSESQRTRLNRFARGHPLALELAAAAFNAKPNLEISAESLPAVLQQLTEAFVSGLPSETIEAVEAASAVRRVTEPILRALLEVPDARDEFRQLRELPFVEVTVEGLVFHDVVRDAVAGSLTQRDPELSRMYRRRAWQVLTQASQARTGLWESTSDLLYLIENPIVRDAFFPPGGMDYAVEPASAADGPSILDIARTTEPPDGAWLLERWWSVHAETFYVARSRDVSVAGFYILFEPRDADPTLLSEDPVTAAWSAHLEDHPVGADEQVLFCRRWLARGAGEALSPPQGACWLDLKRTYMELRPHLRRIYTAVIDLPAFEPIVTPLGFVAIDEANVSLGGVTYHSAVNDFGPQSIDGWLARLIGIELGLPDDQPDVELPGGTVSILFMDVADSTALTSKLGDKAYRERERSLAAQLRDAITDAGGSPVEGKVLGDGIMAVFPSARQAIYAACACRDRGDEAGLPLHLGIHAGDVDREGNNVHGGTVQLASRVVSAAAPGEILVSRTVRDLARTSAGVAFDDRGEHELKGIDEPQRLFAVRAD